MKKLQPNETVLTATWIMKDGQVSGDATAERIDWLLAHHLRKIGSSPDSGGWETLYQDPDDGRYWEHTYPESEMHGGGPSQLRFLTGNEAKQKYNVL